MKITNEILDNLTSQVKANSRLRQALDLRTSPEDNSQRILNTLELGTILPIYRNSTETMVMIRGSLIECFYNDDGTLAEKFEMRLMGDCSMIQIKVLKLSNQELSYLKQRVANTSL